ncbi:MAG: hypothetical protein KDH93_21305 [Rhodoferax sp.]|nr:hypothetical protein [Rhodoferax sp.]MCP5263653.1 hypothetical protein [Rhodoferax sp.]
MTARGTSDVATIQAEGLSRSAAVAAPAAATRSKPQTMREFERAMRELGYSQREAVAIALHGFKAIDGTVEAMTHAQIAELASLLERNLNLLKEPQS